MAEPRWPDRIYRALLRLFPREFRGDFGEQMEEDFRDQRADAAGRRSAPRLWRRTVVDALRRAPREHLDILIRDAGYALRLFRRHPGTSVSVLLTLAIGIGLTAAVFSVAHGVLWQPVPLPESERLVVLSQVSPAPERTPWRVSPDNFLDWRRDTRMVAPLVSLGSRTATVLHGDIAEDLAAAYVTEGFFELLGARPVLGRAFSPADYETLASQIAARPAKGPRTPPAPGAAILSHEAWRRVFGARPDIVGQSVEFGRVGRVEIVGVLGPDAIVPLVRDAGVWLPEVVAPAGRRAKYLMVAGRLAPGASLEAAQAEFDVIAARLADAHPDANAGQGIAVTPLREHVAADARTHLWFLLGTAGCVLLIACANVSNLLLAHTSGRQRELATRAALGASRAHLARQALTEGLVLALAGGLAGFLLASWATPALIALAPNTIPRLDEVSIGWPVLGFTAATALVAGLTCAAAAAIAAGRAAPGLTLRSHRAAGSSGRPRARTALVAGQVAVAVMLAVAAGLLVQTMRAVLALPLGFDPSRTISIGFSPEISLVRTPSAKAALERELIDAIRAVDGVTAAGVGSRPLTPGGMSSTFARASTPNESTRIVVEPAGPGYLEALGGRMQVGRFFTDADGPRGPLVAIINRTAEARYFPEGAVGQRIVRGDRQLLIVGVLADVRRQRIEDETAPTLYVPCSQESSFSVNNLLVRTTDDPRALLPAIRTVVRQVDPRLPLTRIQTLPETLDAALAPRRFTLWLVGLFSLVALGLSAIGIYGALAESVAQRVPEIGVRMALGATAAGVTGLFMRQGGWMIAAGVVVGIGGAIALGGVMTSFVFQVPTTDPWSIAWACLIVAVAGLVACAIPARRAARVDPVVALRQE